MSKQETESNKQVKTVDVLKEEYTKRVDEVDNFSKRIFNMYSQVNAEFLYGYLNTIQHSLELQNKLSSQYGSTFIPQFMTGIIKQNTNAWIHFMQNMDTVYVEILKNLKNNVRAMNSNVILGIQSLEKGYGVFEKMQPNIKNEQKSETLQEPSESVIEEIKTKSQ